MEVLFAEAALETEAKVRVLSRKLDVFFDRLRMEVIGIRVMGIAAKTLFLLQDSMTWRSVDGAEVVLRGARLENLSEIERSALQLLAAQRLAKMLPGVNLGKPKGRSRREVQVTRLILDPLSALRQKRQKLVKSNRTPTVADVQRRASGTPCPEEKRVFGVSLAMCMMNEKRLDQESRCRSLDDSTVCMLNK